MTFSLAIDSATSRTQFALLKDNELVWLEHEDGATSHGDVLAKFGSRLVQEKIDQVIVGMGPGPFTGLRTGIIFAKAFAFAREIPISGICTLDAIAYGIDLPEYIVATDARRKELYWAIYKNGLRNGHIQVTSPTDIPKLPVFGEGALKYQLTSDQSNMFPNLLSFPKLDLVKEPLYLRHPDAVAGQK